MCVTIVDSTQMKTSIRSWLNSAKNVKKFITAQVSAKEMHQKNGMIQNVSTLRN